MTKHTTVFISVLLIKLVTESIGRYSENCYLLNYPFMAAASSSLTVLLGIPVARLAIAKNDNVAVFAIVVAVFITTYFGAVHLHD